MNQQDPKYRQWRKDVAMLINSRKFKYPLRNITTEDFKHRQIIQWTADDQMIRFYNKDGSIKKEVEFRCSWPMTDPVVLEIQKYRTRENI